MNILSSSIIMTRTYGMSQGSQLDNYDRREDRQQPTSSRLHGTSSIGAADSTFGDVKAIDRYQGTGRIVAPKPYKGYASRKQPTSGLEQGASKMADWDATESRQDYGSGGGGGQVGPMQYYRIPGDPDRALHRKTGSWYRLLGSDIASQEYKDPLGANAGTMLSVTGGGYNLLSGTGAVGNTDRRGLDGLSPNNLLSRVWQFFVPSQDTAAARNPGSRTIPQRRDQDEGGSITHYYSGAGRRTAISDVEHPVREGFGDGTTTSAFDYGSTLVDAQSSLLNEVSEEDAAAQKLMLAYAEANSALINDQNEYVTHTDQSFKYRNQFVRYDDDGQLATGYVTHRGALRPVSAGVLPTIKGERGCPSLVGQNEVQKSFFFEGSPMTADEPCPPSGRNIEVMGASLAANNTSSWHDHCFADDTMEHQADLPTNPRELVMESCHARAADVGASAYSVYNQDNEGNEFQCFITHKDYSELTENKEPSTIEVTTDDNPLISKEIGDEDDGNSYMATILNNGEFVLGPEDDVANASARIGFAVGGCDPRHGAPISVTEANLGTNCIDRDTCFLMDPTGAMCADQLKAQAEAAQDEQDRLDAEAEQARLEAETAAAAPEEVESGPELVFLSSYDTCPDQITLQDAMAIVPQEVDLSQREEVRKTVATPADCARWDGVLYKEKDRAGIYMGLKEPEAEPKGGVEEMNEFTGREDQLLPLSTYDTCPAINQNKAGERISYVDLTQHKIGNTATSSDCSYWDGTLYKDRDLKGLAGTVYMGVTKEPVIEELSEFAGREAQLLPLSTYDTCPGIAQNNAGEKISYVDLAQHKVGDWNDVATAADCPDWDGTLYKDRNLKGLAGPVYMGVKASGTAPEQVLREQMSEFTGAYETDPAIIQNRCNAANPDWGTVQATKVKCVANGCNNSLGISGAWMDLCNAEHPGWSCCAKDYKA